MGVDWITCEICSENFPDCGPHGWCANCGARLCEYCHEEQVETYGNVEEGSELSYEYGDSAAVKCDLCSGVIIQDDTIIDYLLNKVHMTKEEIIKEIKNGY